MTETEENAPADNSDTAAIFAGRIRYMARFNECVTPVQITDYDNTRMVVVFHLPQGWSRGGGAFVKSQNQ